MILASVTNVGQTPAVNVQRSIRMVPPTDDVRPCAQEPRGRSGPTVFPGETVELLPMPTVADWRSTGGSVGKNELAFAVLICVSYQTGASNTLRTTGSTYLVERHLGERDTVRFGLGPRTYPEGEVHLHRFSSNDEAT
jgi:hypothetical protein